MVDRRRHLRISAARRQPGGADARASCQRPRSGGVLVAAKTAAVGPGGGIAVPQCEKGIGSVITSPDSAKLIAGVRIAPLALWPDDRGYFLEVQRFGKGLAAA